jgi:hypothetical protein
MMAAEGQSNSQDPTGRDNREESRGLTSWIKNRMGGKGKENQDQKRTKSPSGEKGAGSGGIFPTRGKSIDIKRSTEDEKQTANAPTAKPDHA